VHAFHGRERLRLEEALSSVEVAVGLMQFVVVWPKPSAAVVVGAKKGEHETARFIVESRFVCKLQEICRSLHLKVVSVGVVTWSGAAVSFESCLN